MNNRHLQRSCALNWLAGVRTLSAWRPRGVAALPDTFICVIDDDDDVRRLVCSALRRAGYAIVEARDGAQGIKRVEETNVGVIVTDIVMPDREGLETIRELKARFPLVRILAMSGAGGTGLASYL